VTGRPSRARARRLGTTAALLLGLCGPACAAKRPPPPASPAPELQIPSRAIPADLDVALRIDLVQLRRALGDEAAGALELGVVDASDVPAAGLLADALERADAVWIAFRPGLSRELTDNVVILRGRFHDVEPRSYRGAHPWGPPSDLGGDVRRYEREPPERRSAPARAYLYGDGLVVLLSEAEIDSVERRIEQGGSEPSVEPPDRGTVSVALRVARVLPLLGDRFPAVTTALAEAAEASGHASFDALGLRGSFEVGFPEAKDAEGAREAAATLLDRIALARGVPGMVARSISARAVGSTLVLELSMGLEPTARLVACASRGIACDEGAPTKPVDPPASPE
jgi:hypothetical protein